MKTNQINNETINSIEKENNTMKDYLSMNWRELVSYAKEMGINTGFKKKVDIISELNDMHDKIADGIITVAGDMSADKYYPESQQEPVVDKKALAEQKIIAAINRAGYNATYNNMAVRYIMANSLHTIVKYNLDSVIRTEENIAKVIAGLIKNNILYKCNNRFYGIR